MAHVNRVRTAIEALRRSGTTAELVSLSRFEGLRHAMAALHVPDRVVTQLSQGLIVDDSVDALLLVLTLVKAGAVLSAANIAALFRFLELNTLETLMQVVGTGVLAELAYRRAGLDPAQTAALIAGALHTSPGVRVPFIFEVLHENLDDAQVVGPCFALLAFVVKHETTDAATAAAILHLDAYLMRMAASCYTLWGGCELLLSLAGRAPEALFRARAPDALLRRVLTALASQRCTEPALAVRAVSLLALLATHVEDRDVVKGARLLLRLVSKNRARLSARVLAEVARQLREPGTAPADLAMFRDFVLALLSERGTDSSPEAVDQGLQALRAVLAQGAVVPVETVMSVLDRVGARAPFALARFKASADAVRALLPRVRHLAAAAGGGRVRRSRVIRSRTTRSARVSARARFSRR